MIPKTEPQTKAASSGGNLLSTQMSDAMFKRYQALIYDKCRIHLKAGKKPLVVNRLLKRLRELQISDFETYFERVTQSPHSQQELQYLIDAITTNKTEFFREAKQWDFLEQKVWKEMIEEKRKSRTYTFRIWSSACSTGEEPYSLAMHALENIQGSEPWNIKILASDISEKVLAQAREGVYEDRKVDTIPPALLRKYFLRGNGCYKVKPEIQKLVTFMNINLKEPFTRFTSPFDIIFCRNVIIYFDRPTQADLMKRYHGCLRKGGYLFLGHSESLNGICDLYRFVSASIYRKEG